MVDVLVWNPTFDDAISNGHRWSWITQVSLRRGWNWASVLKGLITIHLPFGYVRDLMGPMQTST
jgi:hypothetical protein